VICVHEEVTTYLQRIQNLRNVQVKILLACCSDQDDTNRMRVPEKIRHFESFTRDFFSMQSCFDPHVEMSLVVRSRLWSMRNRRQADINSANEIYFTATPDYRPSSWHGLALKSIVGKAGSWQAYQQRH